MSSKLFTMIDSNISHSGILSTLVDKVLDRLAPKMTASAATCQTLLNYSLCFKTTQRVDAPMMCGGSQLCQGNIGTVYYYSNGRKVYLGGSDQYCCNSIPYPSCPTSTCS